MENEKPQQSDKTNNNQVEPVNKTSAAPSLGISGGMKVIQPLDRNLKVEPMPIKPTPSTTSSIDETNTKAEQPTDSNLHSEKVPLNPSSIYPDATEGITAASYQIPVPGEDKIEKIENYTFQRGSKIGVSIFWTQLIVGFVLGIILLIINLVVLNTKNTSLIAIVLLVYFLLSFFIVAYIPYYTLKNNYIEDTFWLTIFGIAIQLFIVTIFYFVLVEVLIRLVINHSASSSVAHVGSAGVGAFAIIIYILSFVLDYFLIKTTWGLAFLFFGKINNKIIIKAIGIAIIALFISSISYHFISVKKVQHNVKVAASGFNQQSTEITSYFNTNGI